MLGLLILQQSSSQELLSFWPSRISKTWVLLLTQWRETILDGTLRQFTGHLVILSALKSKGCPGRNLRRNEKARIRDDAQTQDRYRVCVVKRALIKGA
jgi:hypothetical protein